MPHWVRCDTNTAYLLTAACEVFVVTEKRTKNPPRNNFIFWSLCYFSEELSGCFVKLSVIIDVSAFIIFWKMGCLRVCDFLIWLHVHLGLSCTEVSRSAWWCAQLSCFVQTLVFFFKYINKQTKPLRAYLVWSCQFWNVLASVLYWICVGKLVAGCKRTKDTLSVNTSEAATPQANGTSSWLPQMDYLSNG